MLRILRNNKKGQNVAEYALTFSLVVGSVIAMTTYAQRSLQGRLRDASIYLTNQTDTIGGTAQYEPYYLETQYIVSRNEEVTQIQGQRGAGVLPQSSGATGVFRMEENSLSTRETGFQSDDYDTSLGLIDGL